MSLKIIIDKEFENPLLSRKQIYFRIIHQKLPTPTRTEVRKKIAAQFNADLRKVFITKLDSKYGQELTVGYAKIYDSPAKAREIEPKHIIQRNQPIDKKKSKE